MEKTVVVSPKPAGRHRGGNTKTGACRWWHLHRAGGDRAPAAVVAQVAALEAGELLALARHLRPRLVPGEEPPAPAVAERIVEMEEAELRELVRRLRERLALESAQG